MGLQLSKEAQKEPDEDLQEGSIPSTPILAAKNNGKNDSNVEDYELDPRSPSQFFSRTPVQLIDDDMDEEVDYKNNFHMEETPERNFKILGIDPRSPSTDFNRTPIVVSASPDKNVPTKLHNKNFDNVFKNTLVTPTRANIIPPKLLESSPIAPKPDAYKRKSFVGLLETNIDFTETDLDVVIREKYHTPKQETLQDYVDPRSPTTDFVRTPIQIIKKLVELDINTVDAVSDNEEQKSEIVKHDCEFPFVKSNSYEDISQEGKNIDVVAQEAEVLDISKESSSLELEAQTDIGHETKAGVEQKIHSAPVSPPSVLAASPKRIQSEPTTPPYINLTADVKELDKKLTNLIYEDDSMIYQKIVKNKEQNRTPLSDRNGTVHKKPCQKLKVSDKPRKPQFTVSKIPVFKEKKPYCENTPPTNTDSRHLKAKKSQWDNDTTLVI